MSEFNFTYVLKDNNNTRRTLNCTLEYTPAERGSYEDGLQMEPDYPAEAILLDVTLEGTDVYFLLSEELINEIEVESLLQEQDY